jgi:hypothetical protein
MRYMVLLAALFFWAQTAFSQTMNTILRSGNVDSVLIEDVQKITFSDASMSIHLVAGGTDSIPLDSIRKIFFDPNGTVPVVLSSMTAAYQGNGILLSWTTQTEQDNLGWNVLRSATSDGAFVPVNGSLVPGSGSTAMPHTYSFTDATAAGGMYYYQLEQIDINGGKTYSWVVAVNSAVAINYQDKSAVLVQATGTAKSRITPNPVGGPVNIEVQVEQKSKVTIGVYNAQGTGLVKMVQDGELVTGKHSIVWDGRNSDGQAVKTGTYLVKINNGTAVEIAKCMLINGGGK